MFFFSFRKFYNLYCVNFPLLPLPTSFPKPLSPVEIARYIRAEEPSSIFLQVLSQAFLKNCVYKRNLLKKCKFWTHIGLILQLFLPCTSWVLCIENANLELFCVRCILLQFTPDSYLYMAKNYIIVQCMLMKFMQFSENFYNNISCCCKLFQSKL